MSNMNKALQVMGAVNEEELEGEGWFRLFGEGIEESLFGRWVTVEEPTPADYSQTEDIFEEGETVSPPELEGRASDPLEALDTNNATWSHYCKVEGAWVDTDKGYPCDFCGAEDTNMESSAEDTNMESSAEEKKPWSHFCTVRGHTVFTTKGEACPDCGAVE